MMRGMTKGDSKATCIDLGSACFGVLFRCRKCVVAISPMMCISYSA